MSRVTRSISRRNQEESSVETVNTKSPNCNLRSKHPPQEIRYLTEQQFSKELSTLGKSNRKLLLQKQKSLRNPSYSNWNILNDLLTGKRGEPLAKASAAVLVFAGESAGTAICISPEGLILTCAHCLEDDDDNDDDEDNNKTPSSSPPNLPTLEFPLLFTSGLPIKAKCLSLDPNRDLALLQITTALVSQSSSPFPFASISQSSPRSPIPLICIGHPGSSDLETPHPNVPTNYDILHASEGYFRGLNPGQDPQDNSEIGALMHDCWTYWGHSGAPLLEAKMGEVVGLHSSWDEGTGMRRGVGLEALRGFLGENLIC